MIQTRLNNNNNIRTYRNIWTHRNTALNKTFMKSDGIGQLSRFHCIILIYYINYGTQIVSLKKSQSAANIWDFP